jgi:hypothetical protein
MRLAFFLFCRWLRHRKLICVISGTGNSDGNGNGEIMNGKIIGVMDGCEID